MSDLTDNSIYPSAERLWLCIRLNNVSLSKPILAKKIIFSVEAHFDFGGYVNKQNFRIWGTANPHACIEKPTHPKRVTVWCGFWSKGISGPFFFENQQGKAITVSGDRFCSQKLKRRILATFGFNMTVLRATQPKLHSMLLDVQLSKKDKLPQFKLIVVLL